LTFSDDERISTRDLAPSASCPRRGNDRPGVLRPATTTSAAARPTAGALCRAAAALYARAGRARLWPGPALGRPPPHSLRSVGPRPLRLEPPLERSKPVTMQAAFVACIARPSPQTP